jgi:hypothetical protein
MKRYSVTYQNGHRQETSSCHEAANFVNYEGSTFFLSGRPTAPAVFFGEVSDACHAAWEKKAETHKRVRVLHGSSVASYVEKWVRK